MQSGLQLDSTNYGVTLAVRVAVSDYITNLIKKRRGEAGEHRIRLQARRGYHFNEAAQKELVFSNVLLN